MTKVYSNLLHDGIIIMMHADDTQILDYIHNNHSYSLAHAIAHEGYSVVPYSAQVADIYGKTARCAETKKTFVVASEDCTGNYATNKGEILSNEGINIRECRELWDHSKPYVAYVSSDGGKITGWKGNELMTITRSTTYRLTRQSYVHGDRIQSIVARDVHGALWYGRGNAGMSIVMRAYKTK